MNYLAAIAEGVGHPGGRRSTTHAADRQAPRRAFPNPQPPEEEQWIDGISVTRRTMGYNRSRDRRTQRASLVPGVRWHGWCATEVTRSSAIVSGPTGSSFAVMEKGPGSTRGGTMAVTEHHRRLIETDAQTRRGLNADQWRTDEDGNIVAAFGRWFVTEDGEDEDRGLLAGAEGELTACVVGAVQYNNERVAYLFTEAGFDSSEEVQPFFDVEPL